MILSNNLIDELINTLIGIYYQKEPYDFLMFTLLVFKFDDGSFNAVVDKGGLDALMEPKLGSRLGILYLSEVLD